MIRYNCPNPECKRKLKAEDSHAGRRVRCGCGCSHVVPAASTRPSSGSPTTVPSPQVGGSVGDIIPILEAEPVQPSSPAPGRPAARPVTVGPQAHSRPPAAAAGQKLVPLNGIVPAHLLGTPLDVPVLGNTMSPADLYGLNGFRLVGVPACVEGGMLEGASKQFMTMYKLDRATALQTSTHTNYDDFLTLDDASHSVAQLRDSTSRLRWEMFWPHWLGNGEQPTRMPLHIASANVLSALTAAANNGKGRSRTLARHSLAVVHHNVALGLELAHIAGRAPWTDEHWKKALGYWAEVIADEEFWAYLRARVKAFDDLSLKEEDVADLRTQLPRLLLNLNALFARTYARAGHLDTCFRHLRLVLKSHLEQSARHEQVVAAVRLVVDERLEPLTRRVKAELLDASGKFTRPRFNTLCAPILDQAREMCRQLREELHLSENLLGRSEFDNFCDTVLQAVNKKIDYDTDDRPRSILYSMLLTKRLLAFPLSPIKRREMEQSIRRDAEILYRGFELPQHLEGTQCWFLDGEEADPDASLELPVYKIVKVEGGSVQWESRRILVPRSELTAKIHAGKVKPADLKARDARGRELLAEIDNAQATCDEKVRGIEGKRDQAVVAEQSQYQTQLAAFNRQVAPQEDHDHQELARIHGQLKNDVAAEQARLRQACAAAEERVAGPLAAAQAARHEVAQRNKGLRGGLRLELPACALASALFAGFGILISLAGIPTREAPGYIAPLLGGVFGILCGFVAGRFVRAYRVYVGGQEYAELQRQLQADTEELTAASQETVRKLKEAAGDKGKTPQKRLDTLTAQRAKLKHESDARITAVRQGADAEIKAARRATAKTVQALEDQILSRVKPKPETDKSQFPAYRKALSNGYRDGTKPSDYEIERLVKQEMDTFMSSLDEIDRVMLQVLASRLPRDDFAQLLSGLLSLPPGERRTRLQEMRRKLIGF